MSAVADSTQDLCYAIHRLADALLAIARAAERDVPPKPDKRWAERPSELAEELAELEGPERR